jgi:hypothetical protein
MANVCDVTEFYLTANAIASASNKIGQTAVGTITPKATISDP